MLLYLYTFIRKGFISNNHFQELLGVSRNTALADVKTDREACEAFGLTLAYTRAEGYHLKRTEKDKHRLALYAISHLLKSPI